jgi:hypothetical protein
MELITGAGSMDGLLEHSSLEDFAARVHEALGKTNDVTATAVLDTLAQLPSNEQYVLIQRLGNGKTHRQIAAVLDVSIEGARQIYLSALKRLRGMMGATTPQTPVEYLGLGTRLCNALRRDGIGTAGDLLRLTEDGLLRLPCLGKRGAREVMARARGLAEEASLRGDAHTP